jgi:nitric-oxide synthase
VRVRDRRHVTGAARIAAEVVTHLTTAAGDGHIVPTVTVFAPDTPRRPGPRIWGAKLPSHAGHLGPDGATTGDRRTIVMTAATRRLGWSVPTAGRFDPLPIVVVTAGREPMLTPLPETALRHVLLRHPRYPWLAGLDLRWPALDSVDLGGAEPGTLDIGGVRYASVIASTWHSGSDIGRELADPDSYDVLPMLAARMGLDTSCETSLWRDRALVELNAAILYSFRRAGVTVADHHTESSRLRRLLGWEAARALGA